jgi:dihydrofolate reductase
LAGGSDPGSSQGTPDPLARPSHLAAMAPLNQRFEPFLPELQPSSSEVHCLDLQDAPPGPNVDICLIWANARNRAGHEDNSTSWLGAEDLRRFHSLTERHPVLMGCRTWEKIPRALLAGRQSFVLSKKKSIPGAIACASLQDALTMASVLRSGKVFLIGGTSLYEPGLRVADRLYVACFEPDADGALPPIDPRQFELVRQDRTGSVGPTRLLQEYRRRQFH